MNIATIKAEIASLQSDLLATSQQAKAYRAGMLEGGEGYNPHQDDADSIEERIFNLNQQIKFADGGEWSKAATIERRGEWNQWVKSFKGPVPRPAMIQKIKAQGWQPSELKAAVEHHGL